MPSLVLRLRLFAAFAYYGSNRFISVYIIYTCYSVAYFEFSLQRNWPLRCCFLLLSKQIQFLSWSFIILCEFFYTSFNNYFSPNVWVTTSLLMSQNFKPISTVMTILYSVYLLGLWSLFQGLKLNLLSPSSSCFTASSVPLQDICLYFQFLIFSLWFAKFTWWQVLLKHPKKTK